MLPTASPPDGLPREENAKRMRKIGASLRRLVTVPVGDAFWMTLVRAIMRAMTLVSGQAAQGTLNNTVGTPKPVVRQ